ncbi:MAG TPA: UDP-glucose/GDP-mannose dehydrogenase family protein, partial [Mycobacterium sp.]|nr:UDP-glucose/GDP-mannose dehydrogenase family protein [Mycobacterium sp.]
MDVDTEKVATLRAGRVPFYEPKLDDVLTRNIASGRLRFTTSYQEAADFGDVHFICVGTPQQSGSYAADMTYVNAVIDGIGPYLTRPCLVVGKSTVPVGTADQVAEHLQRLAPAGSDAEVAWNPEFLREGHAVDDTLRPDRLVIGVRSASAEKVLREVYQRVLDNDVPLVVTDFATAELVKAAANAFLATKISFINAMAEVCEAAGADITQLSEALGHDPRIGGQFLRAGLGFGGGCLPKDIRAFMARAGELGVEQALTFLREVDDINLRRRDRLVEMATDELGGSVRDKRIAVLGAAFKPESDDVRDSPALHVAASLHMRGAAVSVYDPAANGNASAKFPGLDYVNSTDAALADADVVLVLTEWAEFKSLDPDQAAGKVRQKRILDGRLCLDPQRWRDAGWIYRAPGRQ